MPTDLILLACVLACPVLMLGMMWFMHRQGGGSGSERDPAE